MSWSTEIALSILKSILSANTPKNHFETVKYWKEKKIHLFWNELKSSPNVCGSSESIDLTVCFWISLFHWIWVDFYQAENPRYWFSFRSQHTTQHDPWVRCVAVEVSLLIADGWKGIRIQTSEIHRVLWGGGGGVADMKTFAILLREDFSHDMSRLHSVVFVGKEKVRGFKMRNGGKK